MPQVVSDSSVQTGIVSNGGLDLFSYPDTPSSSILDFQTPTGSPAPAGTATATGLITPDMVLAERLKNFPDSIYDLSATSTLTHFMQALLGDSGVGQIRKRQLISQLQSAVTSTHFYDLDSFYGALFGAIRGPSGTLPVNPATGNTVSPYTDLATPDAWDEILAIDAQFRERIIALAKAITLGGTVPGLRALAEAITASRCQIFEVWRLIDGQGPQSSTTYTWATEQTTYATWAAFVPGTTWQTVVGISAAETYGGLGINSRSEVIISPAQTYPATPAGQAQQNSDMYGISSVVEVLQPANVLVSVEMGGALVNTPVTISAIWADSDNAELVSYVTPASQADPAYLDAISAYRRRGSGRHHLPGPVPAVLPEDRHPDQLRGGRHRGLRAVVAERIHQRDQRQRLRPGDLPERHHRDLHGCPGGHGPGHRRRGQAGRLGPGCAVLRPARADEDGGLSRGHHIQPVPGAGPAGQHRHPGGLACLRGRGPGREGGDHLPGRPLQPQVLV